MIDKGASFAIASGWLLTLFIAAPPNGSSVWVRVIDEVTGAVFEREITAELPAATQYLPCGCSSTPARRPPPSPTTAPGSNLLRIHLQNLDIRARSIHPRPDPPDAGTEHVATNGSSINYT
jgi:hypothetical protein